MREWSKSPVRPIRIGLLLFDSYSNLCLANCLEPMRAANMLAPEPVYDWQVLSLNGAPVSSSSGLSVMARAPLADMAPADYLMVLASYDHLHHDTAPARAGLRRAARRAQVMVGFDAAPWLMAAAGLLDGRAATLHGALLDSFAENFHRIDARTERIVRDGNRITCAGGLSALDLSLDLITDHLGHAMRLEIETLFLRDEPGPRAGRQGPTQDALLRRALGLMQDNLENPLPLAALAAALGCQPRTLDRRFRAGLGAPPGRVYRHLRLASARQMVEGTRLSVAEIALRCGYDDPAALTRAFRARFGHSPRALRAMLQAANGMDSARFQPAHAAIGGQYGGQ